MSTSNFPQLLIRLTPKIKTLLDEHIAENGLNRSTWFELAVRGWLEHLEETGDDPVIRAAPSAAKRVGVYIDPALLEQLYAVSPLSTQVDVHWTLVVWYLQTHDLLTSSKNETPSILTLQLEPEHCELIESLVEDGIFETRTALWKAVAEHWFQIRNDHVGHFFDYFEPPWRRDDKELCKDVHVIMSRAMHTRALYWASRDNVIAKVLYYNATMTYINARPWEA